MFELEQRLLSAPQYQQSYCYNIILSEDDYNPLNGQTNYTCAPTDSILLFTVLVPTVNYQALGITASNFAELTDEELARLLYVSRSDISFYLEKDAEITPTRVFSQRVRGRMAFGIPLAGFTTTKDRRSEQDDLLREYEEDVFFDYAVDMYDDTRDEDVQFLYTSETSSFHFLNDVIGRDMLLLIGSFLFIVVFILAQTLAPFVTVFTSLSVVTSFIIANIIYRFVIGIEHFGNLHFLVVFIVLGIGVDDIFILNDIWRNSGTLTFQTPAHRLSYCFRHAAVSMLFTSLTTIVSFAVNIASPFVTMSTLALFGGLSVAVLYCSVVIFFPTVIMMNHKYFERLCICCPSPSSYSNFSHQTQTSTAASKDNLVVRFFSGPYHKFISSVAGAVCVLILTACGLVVFIVLIGIRIDINISLVSCTQNQLSHTVFRTCTY